MYEMKELILRKAIRLLKEAESPLEENVQVLLCNFTDLNFKPQYKIYKYRLDIGFPDYKIALEIDGEKFHNKEADAIRDGVLNSFGWKVERVPGWFCNRYPKATIVKVLRHMPEFHDQPFYRECEHEALLWAESQTIGE